MKLKITAFFMCFFLVAVLQAQNLEKEFASKQKKLEKQKQKTNKKSKVETDDIFPFASKTNNGIPFDMSLSDEENKKRFEDQRAKEEQIAREVDSVEQYFFQISRTAEFLVKDEQKRQAILACEEELREPRYWLVELDKSILTSPRDSLIKRFTYRGLIDFEFTESMLIVNITEYDCGFYKTLDTLKNLKIAEERGLLHMNIMYVLKNMVVEALPNSPETAAANLKKRIEQTLKTFGGKLNYSFEKYERFEKQKAPTELKGLIEFRMNFLSMIVDKLKNT